MSYAKYCLVAIVFLSLLILIAVWRNQWQPPLPKSDRRAGVVDMRDELQHFVIRLGGCNYIAYWTYSYNRSLRLIHTADCPNRDGHVFILSDGSITTKFGKKK